MTGDSRIRNRIRLAFVNRGLSHQIRNVQGALEQGGLTIVEAPTHAACACGRDYIPVWVCPGCGHDASDCDCPR